MKRARFAAMLAAALWVGSCTDQATIDGQQEIAGELRALRTALQANARPATTGPAALDAQAFAAALAPLREVLDGLAAQQRDLQTRQLALTQELQRWAQLLAQSVTGGHRAESEALTARLQELEAALKQQQTRHQEVEKLLGGALDRTAEKLEEFLKRLEAAVPAQDTQPPAPEPAVRKTSALEPGPGADAPTRARRNATAWWLGLLGTAGLAAAVCVWRWRRSAAARGAATAPEPAAGVVHDGAHDPGVQELWAAAAMLGEAVGKLKANQQAAGASAAPEYQDEGIDPAEVFVLDEEVPAPATAPAVPVPAPATAPARSAPPTLRCRVPATDPVEAVAKALHTLADDPRVLRRPAPKATAGQDAIEVTFAVLPHLHASERLQLRSAVQQAAAAAIGQRT